MFKALPTVLVYVALTTQIVLFTISSIYLTPTPFRAFSLELKWDQLFRSKDESAIQLIQAQLECCGLKNMHDRAWPFPGKGIGAYECERSQGWDKSCLNVWRNSLIIASTLSVVSNIAGLICVVRMVRTFALPVRPLNDRSYASPVFWEYGTFHTT
jgi:hypothetical protein